MIKNQFYKAISSLNNTGNSFLPLHEPYFNDSDAEHVLETVKSGWVSYQGQMVKNFETALSYFLEMPYVIPIVNGTSALFITLKALKIGLGDEVLIPSLTFAATANAVIHVGAIPHFIDSCTNTFNVDFDKLETYLDEIAFLNDDRILINKKTKNKIKAIIPVHVLGSSCDIHKLQKIANKYSLLIIEDAAEALGSEYQGKKISALTGTGVVSFNGNKIITTGGGGAIITQDKALFLYITHLSTTAKKPHNYEFDHDEIGYNLRLPALNAALGCSQLQKLTMLLKKKRQLYNNYKAIFREYNFGDVFNPDSFGLSNCWLNAFILNDDVSDAKNDILDFLNSMNIGVRPFWKPLHTLDIYKDCPAANCSGAEYIYKKVICLPSSANLVQDA